MDEDAAGWAYAPDLDRVVAWNDGDTVWLLDPGTFTCTAASYPGGPRSVTNGTYGRFRYSPQSGVFVVCNDIDDNCHTLRLTPGGLVFANGFEG
jgi:outer membrane lipoprotein-sorting protein